MEPWVVTGEFFMGLFVLAYLGWPYLRSYFGREVTVTETSNQGESSINSFVQVISDLEYDFETGKLSEDDYQKLRRKIFKESEVNPEDLPSREESGTESEDPLEDAINDARDGLDL